MASLNNFNGQYGLKCVWLCLQDGYTPLLDHEPTSI